MVSSNSLCHINDRLNKMAGVTDPAVFFGGYLIFFFGSTKTTFLTFSRFPIFLFQGTWLSSSQ